MRLVNLEVEGFKSFGAYASFSISKGITCIVGPNGSGKSNVVDAVRWLFGERANAKLRMSSTSDVLYAGSQSLRRADRAWVKAVFNDKDKTISVERVYTAEGKNVYLLNGSQTRLKDIARIFTGTGTGRDLYSIVGQGEMSNLVNSSPEQIKTLIEEAAGVAIYKAKKIETLSKLSEVQGNLDMLKNIIKEVERTLRSLNLKSKRAQKYKEYEGELDIRKRRYFGHFYLLNSEKMKGIEEKMSNTSSEMEKLQKELFDLEIQTSELKELSSGVEEEIKRFESELEKYREREKTLSNLKEMYSSKLSSDRTAYVELGTKKDSMREELDRNFERLEELRRLTLSLDEEDRKLSLSLEELEKDYEDKTEEISRNERKHSQLEIEISRLTKERNSLEVSKSKAIENVKDLQQRLEILESQIRDKKMKAEKLQQELDEIVSKESNEENTLEEHNKKLMELDSKRKEIENTISSLKKKRETLNFKRVELISKHDILKKSVEEYAGYSRAVRAVMNAQIDGVVDVVANLIDVPKDVEVAVSVLLGGRAQNIVVRDSKSAKDCVEMLKRTRSGRATFIPVDMVDLREPNTKTSIISARGMIGYAFRLVKAVKGYEGLVNFLFSRDLIVRTLSDAIELKNNDGVRSKIVSLDGQLVSSFGTITGGSIERTDFVSNKRLLRDMENKIVGVVGKLKELDAKITDMQISQEIAFKEKNDVERSLLKENLALNNSRNSKKSLISQLVSLQKEVNDLEKLKSDYLRRMEKDRKVVEEANVKMEEIDAKTLQFEIELKGDSTESLKRNQAIEDLQEKMIDLKMKVNSIRERSSGYHKEASRLSKRTDDIEVEISEISLKLETISKDVKESQERLELVERDLSSVRRDMEELFSRSKNSKGSRAETLKKLESLERETNIRRERIENLREELHTLEIDEISLGSAIESSLNELLKSGGSKEENSLLSEEELKVISEEMENYERKLKFLGAVDLSAIDEYGEVEKRHQKLTDQKNDLEKSQASLESVIKRTDEEARDLLVKTLEMVNENFARMISILFSEGNGYLLFTGEDVLDSPIEINVKLPGKRTQKLYMLSGGERSLMGLALIFSLLMINPSAFYILDEVDAALDDFSTQRFVDLLSEYSKNSNFLVMTHNKIVMEKSNTLYGITMVNGTSTVIPVEFSEFSETNVEA